MYDFRFTINTFISPAGRVAVTRALIVLTVLAISACGVKQVTVKDSFPTPVLTQHPQHVGLYLDDNFRNYNHNEKLPGGGKWNIDLGKANVALFQQVLTGMFRQVSLVQAVQSNSGLDAIIKPEIEEYQFSTPDQNQTDYFEAWFKYRIYFYDAQGKKLGDWPLTAYGRSEAQFLNAEDSLRVATRVAMRDAATAMVLEFDQHPAVRAFLYGPESEPAVVTQGDSLDAN